MKNLDAGDRSSPNDHKFVEVDHPEFNRLKRLDTSALAKYMRDRGIDGVYLATDNTLRIVA